jgi:hypothetical protein
MKFVERGEDRAFWWRKTSALPVRARFRGSEFKGKIFKARQHGEESDDRFR